MKIRGRSDRVIKPGETDQLTVTISTKNRMGPLKRKVVVTTNDPNHPKVTLTGEVKVLAAMKVAPRTVRFSRLTPDSEPKTSKLKIARGDGGPLSLTLLPHKEKNIQAVLTEVKPGEEYELLVTASPPWPAKGNQRSILSFSTGLTEAPRESITVYISMLPSVETDPTRVIFRFNKQRENKQVVRLAWNNGKVHRIIRARCSDPGVTVEVVGEKASGQRVAVSIPAGYVPLKTSAKLIITTGDKENSRVTVPVLFAGLPDGPRSKKEPTGNIATKAAPKNARSTTNAVKNSKPKPID